MNHTIGYKQVVDTDPYSYVLQSLATSWAQNNLILPRDSNVTEVVVTTSITTVLVDLVAKMILI